MRKELKVWSYKINLWKCFLLLAVKLISCTGWHSVLGHVPKVPYITILVSSIMTLSLHLSRQGVKYALHFLYQCPSLFQEIPDNSITINYDRFRSSFVCSLNYTGIIHTKWTFWHFSLPHVLLKLVWFCHMIFHETQKVQYTLLFKRVSKSFHV